MAGLTTIPKRFHSGFKSLISLDDDVFLSIVDGLSLTPLASSLKKVAESVSKIKSLPQGVVQDILTSVGSLTFLLEKGIGLEDLIDDIYHAAGQAKLYETD